MSDLRRQGVHGESQLTRSRVAVGVRGSALASGYDVKLMGEVRHLVEVYPHQASLRLVGAARRVPCAVSKSGGYWPGMTSEARVKQSVREFSPIEHALRQTVDRIDVGLPEPAEAPRLSYLKRFEDVLDALICGWAGICYLEGKAVPYGGQHAAIWVPSEA